LELCRCFYRGRKQETYRGYKKGIGKSIVIEGIHLLREITDEQVFVHINNKNIASIGLHEGIGFKKISSGSINSYGDFRSQVDEYLLETYS
jgi:L-amino acid N-acyltransferase YncA